MFDIVIGNPPYNISNHSADGQSIWQQFITLANENVKDGGYICFVTPDGWRHKHKPTLQKQNVYEIVTKNAIWWRNCKNDFGASIGTSINPDCWIAQKLSNVRQIMFLPKFSEDKYAMSIFEKLHLYNGPCLERANNKLIKCPGTWKVAWTSRRWKKNEWKYFEGKKSISHDSPKVIFSSSSASGCFYDSGDCSINNHSHGVLVKNEEHAKQIISLLEESKLVKFISSHLVSNGSLENPLVWFVSLLPDGNDPYKLLNLTPEEIDYIESPRQRAWSLPL